MMPSKEEWKEIGKTGHKLIFAFMLIFILLFILLFIFPNTILGDSIEALIYNMAVAGENMVVEFLDLFGIEAERRVADYFGV